MNIKSRFVLFSIETVNDFSKGSTLKEKNEVESIIGKYGFKRVLGSYKGILEASYMVLANEDEALKQVLNIAKKYNQESILVVDENRIATLMFLENNDQLTRFTSQKLGRWTSIDALEAKNIDNWTLDGTNYYSVT